MAHLTLSIAEIIILLFGAITLGITIHFFIASNRNLKNSSVETEKTNKNLEEWKLKYFNDMEIRNKDLSFVKQQLMESEENNNINAIEAEEMRRKNKKLQSEIEHLQKTSSSEGKPGYIEQIRLAQSSLMEHNEKISRLLGQIDIIKETEEKQKEILRDNEELSNQIADLRLLIEEKETELSNIRQKEVLTKEMASMLDNAYNEFNMLQEKIQKLESQVSSSTITNMEYEDIKEGHYKMSRDFEEQKLKLNAAITENQYLQAQLIDAEDKLKEANFQRQQLQKRIAYLEEMNNDLQVISNAKKKLESQIKRMGELESMLNVVSEERDQLIRRREEE
jgi:hypothetical protein